MVSSVLGLDYGAKRVGVALAPSDLKLSQPLVTLANDKGLTDELKKLAAEHRVDKVAVGLPRNLDGDDTPQTKTARNFAKSLEAALKLPVYLIDEAATSVQAEARLKAGGKPYAAGDIDSLAAAIILDDFIANYADEL